MVPRTSALWPLVGCRSLLFLLIYIRDLWLGITGHLLPMIRQFIFRVHLIGWWCVEIQEGGDAEMSCVCLWVLHCENREVESLRKGRYMYSRFLVWHLCLLFITRCLIKSSEVNVYDDGEHKGQEEHCKRERMKAVIYSNVFSHKFLYLFRPFSNLRWNKALATSNMRNARKGVIWSQ